MAQSMGVTVRWVQKLGPVQVKYGPYITPRANGKPEDGMHGRREHSAVLSALHTEYSGAASLHGAILVSSFGHLDNIF